MYFGGQIYGVFVYPLCLGFMVMGLLYRKIWCELSASRFVAKSVLFLVFPAYFLPVSLRGGGLEDDSFGYLLGYLGREESSYI